MSFRRGRDANAVRPLVLRVDANASASGSAYVEFGSTKLMAAVYGPKDSAKPPAEFNPIGMLTVDARYAPFAKSERISRGAEQIEVEATLSRTIEQAVTSSVLLDRYPKSVIEVHVLILQSDGAELAASITAVGLALANAGIDMLAVPTAASLVGARASGVGELDLFVDPTATEEKAADMQVDIAVLADLGRVTYFTHAGEVSKDALLKATTVAMEACVAINENVRNVLRNSERRRLKSATSTSS